MAKYCTNCGGKMDSDASFCVECGSYNTGEYKSESFKEKVRNFDKTLILPIIGFVLAASIPTAGLVVSVIAYIKCKKEGSPGKGLAISGISIAGFRIFIGITLIVLSYLKSKGIIN